MPASPTQKRAKAPASANTSAIQRLRPLKGLKSFAIEVAAQVQAAGDEGTSYAAIADILVSRSLEQLRTRALHAASSSTDAPNPHQLPSSPVTASPPQGAEQTPATVSPIARASPLSTPGPATVLPSPPAPLLVASGDATYEEKNIRRRVYDALNVLVALGLILSFEKKHIIWRGVPGFLDTTHRPPSPSSPSFSAPPPPNPHPAYHTYAANASSAATVAALRASVSLSRARVAEARKRRDIAARRLAATRALVRRNAAHRCVAAAPLVRGGPLLLDGDGADLGFGVVGCCDGGPGDGAARRVQLPFVIIRAPAGLRVGLEMDEGCEQVRFSVDGKDGLEHIEGEEIVEMLLRGGGGCDVGGDSGSGGGSSPPPLPLTPPLLAAPPDPLATSPMREGSGGLGSWTRGMGMDLYSSALPLSSHFEASPPYGAASYWMPS